MKIDRKQLLLVSLLLWIFAFSLYIPTLSSGFVNYDDATVLLSNPHLYNENSLLSSLWQILFVHFPREEPLLLRDITWALDSYWHGFKNPFGYHFGNVVIHACNVVLFFLLMVMTTRRLPGPLMIAITFSTLAIHVEPVAWVMGRKDVLVAFFILAGLIAQAARLSSKDRRKRRAFYLATLLATLAALLSKISASSYFMVLAAHQMFHPVLAGLESPESRISRRQGVEALYQVIPHFLITLVIFLWYRDIVSAWGVLDRGMDSFSAEHAKNLFAFTPLVLSMYLKLSFVPHGYSAFYPWPSVEAPPGTGLLLISTCVWIGFLWVGAASYKKRKDVFFYLLVFFLLMLPYLNIIYIGIWVANRYAYLSSACLLLVVAGMAPRLLKQRAQVRTIGFCLWVGFVVLHGVQSLVHQQKWHSEQALWAYENSLSHASPMTSAALSYAYLKLAEAAPDPDHRAALLEQALETIRRGLDRFEKTETRQPPSEVHRLYYLRSLLAGARGESLFDQVAYCMRAFEIRPEVPMVSRRISNLYYQLALSAEDPAERDAYAWRSFDFFKKYLNTLGHDPRIQELNLRLLEDRYARNFPALKDAVEETKRAILESARRRPRA